MLDTKLIIQAARRASTLVFTYIFVKIFFFFLIKTRLCAPPTKFARTAGSGQPNLTHTAIVRGFFSIIIIFRPTYAARPDGPVQNTQNERTRVDTIGRCVRSPPPPPRSPCESPKPDVRRSSRPGRVCVCQRISAFKPVARRTGTANC